MAKSQALIDVDKDAFKATFSEVSVYIREEWPEVEADALAATEGDFDEVVNLVALSTASTKTKVKKHVAELKKLADDLERLKTPAEPEQSATEKAKDLLNKLEARATELKDVAPQDLVKDAQKTIEQNVWVSLLIALGFGFILGLLIRDGRGR